MNTSEKIKESVKQKYSEIALQEKSTNESSCCGSTCGCAEVTSIMADEYKGMEGYNADADLGLGCGLPTQFAKIKEGDTVIDLGSGAGNDAFIARFETGETGKVIGVDMTPVMIEKARQNTEKLGFNNIEFRLGEIEKLPVANDSANVVISNCVLNLVPDKSKAFEEIMRILKPGGHFSISDIVLSGLLPEKIQNAAEMYAGCVAGAILKEEYLKIIKEHGFTNLILQKEKQIIIPHNILLEYMNEEEIAEFNKNGTGIYSITVSAEKPDNSSCCGDDCCGGKHN